MGKMTIDLLSTQRKYLMGFSILYIMLFHITTLNANARINIFDMGNVGVEIFLILSGLGIYNSLSKPNQTLKKFYKNRLNRILSPYLLVTIVFSLYSYLKCEISINHLIFRILGLSTLYEGNKWMWYMTVALFTYLMAPIFKKIADINKPVITFVIIFTLFYFLAILNRRSEIMWTRIPMFYLGMVLGRTIKNRDTLYVNPILGFVFFMIIFPLSYSLYHNGFLGYHHITISRIALNIYSIPLIFCMAYIFCIIPTNFKKIIGWFGNYSFELYLTHLLVIYYTFHHIENLLLYSLLIFAISLPSSYILKKICSLIKI